jgi:hypothetical protein
VNKITSAAWWKAAATRAAKTFGQVAVPLIVGDTTIWGVNWVRILGVSATAVVLSLLTSLKGLPEIDLTDDPTTTTN